MIDTSTNLTRPEARTLAIATLTAACAAIVGGMVSWGFEEAKRMVADRRARNVAPTGKAGDA